MKIVLIGYMASGKSAVGKGLSDSLMVDFIDLDNYIETHENMSITEIFNTKGEIYFRRKEAEYLEELLLSDKSFLLSSGGGTPCYGNNLDLILNKSKSFYLKTSLNELYRRLNTEQSKRPLVASLTDDKLKEFIAKHLFERAPYYEKSAHIISTDNKSVAEVVSEMKTNLV